MLLAHDKVDITRRGTVMQKIFQFPFLHSELESILM